MDTITTAADRKSYARGVRLANLWVEAGGSLDADGPNTRDEAFYNGFIDTINELRKSHGLDR
jgi:hypothetical protein